MKKLILIIALVSNIFAEELISNESSDLENDFFQSIDFENDFFIEESDEDNNFDFNNEFFKESISFTGDFKFDSSYSDYDGKESTIDSSIESNINLDIRLKEGVKAYTSINLFKTNDDTTNIDFIKINEMFFDFNIDNKIYVRGGKQNLAWGRGYYFNPTDLINIEKKKLDDVTAQREGNLGLKIHIPSGVEKNFYAYVQLEDTILVEDSSLALKYEFLFKNSEFSIATILRNSQKYDQLIALDFASSLGKFQTFGEFLIREGDELKVNNDIVLQGTLGYSRDFDRKPKEEDKIITLIQEFYYNGAGFKNKEDHPLYNPYSDAKYYLATFITANKFYHKDLNLSLNILSNLNENIHQLNFNLTYKLNQEVNIKPYFTTYLGEQGNLEGFLPRYLLGLSADIRF